MLPKMRITKRADHNFSLFVKRTFSAQIHLVGVFVFLLATGWLVPIAHEKGISHGHASLIFCLTGLLVFFVSTTYHFLHDGFQINSQLEDFFENLDHCSIYLFIAGTYSPLILNAVAPEWQYSLLTTVWSVAFMGSLYSLFRVRLPKYLQGRLLYTGLFVIMGWLFFLRVGDLIKNLTPQQGIFFCLGGGFYSVGAAFYAFKWPKKIIPHFGYHEVWHLCVLLGAISHLLMISSFYL